MNSLPRPRRSASAEPADGLLGLFVFFTALKWGALLFTVHQYKTVIITRFGKAIRTEKTPGLKLKIPFIDKLHRFDNRILAWEGPTTEAPTKDKLYIMVDNVRPLADQQPAPLFQPAQR